MSVCCEYCVLSGRGLCDGPITYPEESYRLWCVNVCDHETLRMRRSWHALGCWATEKEWLTLKEVSWLCVSRWEALHSPGGTESSVIVLTWLRTLHLLCDTLVHAVLFSLDLYCTLFWGCLMYPLVSLNPRLDWRRNCHLPEMQSHVDGGWFRYLRQMWAIWDMKTRETQKMNSNLTRVCFKKYICACVDVSRAQIIEMRISSKIA
jgi:hypothetical protein